jgi:sulfur carrier protein ThiS
VRIPLLSLPALLSSLRLSAALCALALGAGFLSTQPRQQETTWAAGQPSAATVNGQAIPASRYHALLAFAQRQQAGQPGTKAQGLAQQVLNQLIAN